MKALLCTEHGPASELSLADVPDPTPGKGEVVVDMKAAALNFPDTLIIQGKYQFSAPFPFTPGGEGAGVISALGEGVEGLAPGDEVIVTMMSGLFAEKVAAPAMAVVKKPAALDFNTAAGLTITYGTTIHALKQRAAIRPGEVLLVLGAAGGVGTAAVELGKALGAKVIAGASSAEKLEVAMAAGADAGVNYAEEDLKTRAKELARELGAPGGVDVIYDPVGGELAEAALRAIAPDGRFLVIGFASGEIPRIPLNLALLKQCQIVGVFWGAWRAANPDIHAANMAELFGMLEAGTIKPLISEVHALADYEAAFGALMERRATGKVVFDMSA